MKDESAFAFEGSWREFAPIALTNLLLMIVTLGIYRPWAKTRERRYLWARTRFIDETLEWTGTGLELFIGFVLVVLLFLVPLAALQFGLQALVMRGHVLAAAISVPLLYSALLYLVGLARFRALRYRLSRTLWHGIRGGSDARGFSYGFSYLWKTAAGGLVFGLLIPWAMTELWNQRWRAMSFGPHGFGADASASPLLVRLLVCLGLGFITLVIAAATIGFTLTAIGIDTDAPSPSAALITMLVPLALLLIVAVFPVMFYAAFFREAVGSMTLSDLSFGFEARTKDWVKLYLGDVALIVGTLGIGIAFLGYRHWAFFVSHLRAYGNIDPETLVQSEARAPGQGEGLLEAFDFGAV